MPKWILHRLLASFRIELRLILFNWVYPLLHLLWGILFYQLFVGKDDRSAIALLETTVGRLAIGLISLIGLFLAGISASRSKRVRFLELEETYPTGFEIIAGRAHRDGDAVAVDADFQRLLGGHHFFPRAAGCLRYASNPQAGGAGGALGGVRLH